jgi:L-threonylcarbamoyladenylate synthase
LDADASRIAARLRAGDVLALPTETLYGLSCLASSQSGLARIAAAKRLGAPRAFLVLVDSMPAVEKFLGPLPDARIAAFLRATWPAPLTAILPTRAAFVWGAERDGMPTAAFRVPAHRGLRQLLVMLGEPVVSTSANRTGGAPLGDAASIGREFGSEIDAVVVDASDAADATARGASTLADFTAWPPRVLRPGSFGLETAIGAWTARGAGCEE